MTELKQKAIDFIRKIKRIPTDRSDNQMELFYEEELDLMIGFATETTKELEKQIEKMKSCRSCKHDNHCNHRVCDKSLPFWELRR